MIEIIQHMMSVDSVLIPVILSVFVAGFCQAEDVCKNNLTNCDDYSPIVCGVFPEWSKLNCAKFCQICGEKYSCPKDWNISESDGMCYAIFGITNINDRKIWSSARRDCEKNNATLAVIKSEKENTFVAGLLNVKSYYWMGLKNYDKSKSRSNMIFKFVDDSLLTESSYTNWNKGEPDNKQYKEHCVVITSVGRWIDRGCLGFKPYICQMKLGE